MSVTKNGVTKQLGYDSAHPDRLISYGGKAITYDATGRVSTYDGWDYTWTRGKLSSIRKNTGSSSRAIITPVLQPNKTYSFTYNAFGQRVSKSYSYFWLSGAIVPVTTGEITNYNKQFKYDASGRLIAELINETRYGEGEVSKSLKYLYDESGMIGVQYTNGANTNTYYYLRNLQGDVIGIYNTSGTKVVGYTYDAWGNCTIDSSTTNYELAHDNPIRYRGYYYDEDTGLYYLNSRYYSPEWRRFISPDDTAFIDSETPNGLNLYCYCNNDPVNYADPSGHWIETVLDIGFTLWSLGEYINSPSLENLNWLILDIACLVIPLATGGSTIVKGIVKGANGVDNLLDVSKVPGYILRNADDVVVLGQNMDRVKDAVKKLGGGIIYGGLDNFADIMSKYGKEMAESLGYIDNMKWIAKQAWAGKTVLNIGFEAVRLANPSAFANSFKVCRGEVLYYRLVMLGKFIAFWSHRIYRLFGG